MRRMDSTGGEKVRLVVNEGSDCKKRVVENERGCPQILQNVKFLLYIKNIRRAFALRIIICIRCMYTLWD